MPRIEITLNDFLPCIKDYTKWSVRYNKKIWITFSECYAPMTKAVHKQLNALGIRVWIKQNQNNSITYTLKWRETYANALNAMERKHNFFLEYGFSPEGNNEKYDYEREKAYVERNKDKYLLK